MQPVQMRPRRTDSQHSTAGRGFQCPPQVSAGWEGPRAPCPHQPSIPSPPSAVPGRRWGQVSALHVDPKGHYTASDTKPTSLRHKITPILNLRLILLSPEQQILQAWPDYPTRNCKFPHEPRWGESAISEREDRQENAAWS